MAKDNVAAANALIDSDPRTPHGTRYFAAVSPSQTEVVQKGDRGQ